LRNQSISISRDAENITNHSKLYLRLRLFFFFFDVFVTDFFLLFFVAGAVGLRFIALSVFFLVAFFFATFVFFTTRFFLTVAFFTARFVAEAFLPDTLALPNAFSQPTA
jgi:hypothetical protein